MSWSLLRVKGSKKDTITSAIILLASKITVIFSTISRPYGIISANEAILVINI